MGFAPAILDREKPAEMSIQASGIAADQAGLIAEPDRAL
jgi:hypothetical protein